MPEKIAVAVVGALIVLFAFIGSLVVWGLLTAIPVMLLWNCLMPVIFGLPTISFWQSLGLYTLARCFTPVHVQSS